MYGNLKERLAHELVRAEAAGTLKIEHPLAGAQGAHVRVADADVLNFCANDYLGLANHPAVVTAARDALERWGAGMASVRFICGTQEPHVELERAVSALLGTDDTALFPSCFDANGGVFEALLGPEDTVISDALNHASIIDGIRLCKAERRRYRNRDLADLEAQLRAARGSRHRLVVTDGVFSMDGSIAPLDRICDLAEEHDALVMVDDSHAVGVLGAHGAGTAEMLGVGDRVDVYTGTFGKALGGGSGGYVSGRAEVVATMRQRARPYLFSNSMPPSPVAAARAALELAAGGADLRRRLHENAAHFRTAMTRAGFELLGGDHPIVPVMVGDAVQASVISERVRAAGVNVVAFSYPVVPQGAARIRVQLSAAHTDTDVERCVAAFVAARA